MFKKGQSWMPCAHPTDQFYSALLGSSHVAARRRVWRSAEDALLFFSLLVVPLVEFQLTWLGDGSAARLFQAYCTLWLPAQISLCDVWRNLPVDCLTNLSLCWLIQRVSKTSRSIAAPRSRPPPQKTFSLTVPY